jgi:hypothetical protein
LAGAGATRAGARKSELNVNAKVRERKVELPRQAAAV